MSPIPDKVESIRERLIYEIDAGVFKASDKLPGERTLAKKYEISRNTVRQALAQLEERDIIKRIPSSGAYISSEVLEKIAQSRCGHKIKVAFLLPPDQITNPIIQNIFSVFKNEISSEVKIEVFFIEHNVKSLSADLTADIGIVFAIPELNLLNALRSKMKHLILLNNVHEDFNYIAPDNRSGGQVIAEYLIANGHRKIGGLFYNYPTPNTDFYYRLQGAKETFAAAGIDFSPHLVPPDFYLDKKMQQSVHALFRKEDFTAYIGGCDRLAVELYIALNAAGRAIPKDVSVVGFDDQIYSAFISPPLTTVRYPIEAIGIKLAATVNNFIKSGECNLQELVVPILFKRESSRQLLVD